MPSPLLSIPRIIGHRGAKAYAPENTLASLHTAADLGVDWVEIDVMLTKDEVPIIIHDEDLERTTGVQGLVAETLYTDIQALDAGSWFGESFIGEKIPNLEEALDVILDRGLGLNLELKPTPGREKLTADIAMDMLTRIMDDTRRILISSFQPVSLEAAMDLAPDYPRGFLMPEDWLDERLPEDWEKMPRYLDVSTVHLNGHKISQIQLAKIRKFGKPIMAYTINDAEKAAQLEDWGVTGFFSDAPDELL